MNAWRLTVYHALPVVIVLLVGQLATLASTLQQLLGEKCGIDADCRAHHSICTDQKMCVCEEGFLEAYGDTCYNPTKKRIGQYCVSNVDCPARASCRYGHCYPCQYKWEAHDIYDSTCKTIVATVGEHCRDSENVCYLSGNRRQQKVHCQPNPDEPTTKSCQCIQGSKAANTLSACVGNVRADGQKLSPSLEFLLLSLATTTIFQHP